MRGLKLRLGHGTFLRIKRQVIKLKNYKNNPIRGENDQDTKRQAAMYVRMSTDHQKYSTENQEQAIRDYAVRHNIEIVKTYTDGGKSGLSFSGRDGLKALISDVEAKIEGFSIILVSDVTRWERIQDTD